MTDNSTEKNNTWTFEGKTYNKFTANGKAQISTSLLHPQTKSEIGVLTYLFSWDKQLPFITLENSRKSRFERVGRQDKQEVKTVGTGKPNIEFYKDTIIGGAITKFLPNNETEDRDLDREQMLERIRRSPESISEVVETWVSAGHAEVYIAESEDVFDFVFNPPDEVKVLWYLGSREMPNALALITFKAPSAEARAQYEENAQRLITSKRGDVSISEISANFNKKLEFGSRYLAKVEGVQINFDGNDFDPQKKDEFITLFNPIWFADCVDALFEAFNSTRGK